MTALRWVAFLGPFALAVGVFGAYFADRIT